MSSKKDYYEILEVPKSANDAELKSAYRKKALEWHPDRNKSPEAESRFKEINEAYQVLSDKQKRSQYDQFGHAAFSQGAGGPGGGFGGFNQGPFTYTYSSSQNPFSNMDFGGFNDPFEIFEQFFGGSNPFRNAQNRKPHYSLTIPFMTAIHGGSEEVSIDGKKHTIKIPAGTDTGTRLKFSNFDITFEVSEHPTFKRDGLDIYTDHKISFALAALGGETKITTLEEPLIVKVRSGTQSGSMVRLSGKGVVSIRSLSKKDRGDLYVRFVVEVPKNLSKKQKQLLEEFERVSL